MPEECNSPSVTTCVHDYAPIEQKQPTIGASSAYPPGDWGCLYIILRMVIIDRLGLRSRLRDIARGITKVFTAPPPSVRRRERGNRKVLALGCLKRGERKRVKKGGVVNSLRSTGYLSRGLWPAGSPKRPHNRAGYDEQQGRDHEREADPRSTKIDTEAESLRQRWAGDH